MQKKERVSPTTLTTPSVNADAFKSTAELPTAQAVKEAVSELTGKPNPVGRPIKQTAVGRVKFTTSLPPHLLKWFKKYAIDSDQTAADVVEMAMLMFKEEKERNR